MSWTLLLGFAATLFLATLTVAARRAALRRMAQTVAERNDAKNRGSHQAQLQFPNIDLNACIGCGTCIAACPEEGVLGLVHGQAAVIHGARCVGHGLCAVECPVDAIVVTIGDVSSRRDLPALAENLEAVGNPGLFLAGEVTGYALIRTAIRHGVAVADEVAQRTRRSTPASSPRIPARTQTAAREDNGQASVATLNRATTHDDVLDLCIVGAGPSGLACSLGARSHGLSFVTIDQAEDLGGTVAKYPRRKLVMTQPVDLPLHGTVAGTEFEKEDLVELWTELARDHDLPIQTGEELVDLTRDDLGIFSVQTRTRTIRARHVCLGIGRRGTPRKLGVPGEELPKVAYSLIDAQSYRGRNILVVGGGDSAIEAALGLAEQPGNRVTLSYRKAAFFRLKSKNERRLQEAAQNGSLDLKLSTEVRLIQPDRVDLIRKNDRGEETSLTLENDEVFVFVGGIPPFSLLESAGVSFDPEDRPEEPEPESASRGLLRALIVGLALTCATLGWSWWFADYYGLPIEQRAQSDRHDVLRPSGTLGLTLGIAATLLILANLAYLLRRSRMGQRIAGSLQDWLSYHIATGMLAMLLALVHGALDPRSTSGGHAFWCLLVLVASGAVGRYFYSFLPRATNGRALALDEVRNRLGALASEWDVASRGFGDTLRNEFDDVVRRRHWERSFVQRIVGLVSDNARLRSALRRLRQTAAAEGIPKSQTDRMLGLLRRAQRTAQAAGHYEDLRGLLASWRFVHRWVAFLMVLLVVVHVIVALRYGSFAA